ncbi:MAG: protease HtpX [Chlamydiota bacterium]
MAIAKRIFLFIVVNILVMTMLTVILSLFNVKPYLQSHGIDYTSLMIFCLVWGMGGAFISLALSKVMAKWMMGVKIIDPNTSNSELQNLLSTVHGLCRSAHMNHMPEVGVYESPELNAFATGPSQKHSLIAVSTGLLRKMSQQELEGVLSHEITHITNGDMVTMTLIQGIVNAFVMFLARALAFVFSNMGRDKNSSSSGSYLSYTLFVFLFQFVFMILGSIVVAWFSRVREFRADLGGSYIVGKEKMIAALEALQRTQRIQDPKLAKPSFESMKISTPKKMGWLKLFSSHPPLEERISKLKESF